MVPNHLKVSKSRFLRVMQDSPNKSPRSVYIFARWQGNWAHWRKKKTRAHKVANLWLLTSGRIAGQQTPGLEKWQLEGHVKNTEVVIIRLKTHSEFLNLKVLTCEFEKSATINFISPEIIQVTSSEYLFLLPMPIICVLISPILDWIPEWLEACAEE